MISFVSPFWLLTIPLGLVSLYFVHKRGGKDPAKKIPSLFLYKGLDQQIQRQKKSTFTARFFVESLILLLLAALAASINLPNFGERYTLLIDNSPSMAGLSPTGQNTFQAAIGKAKDFIDAKSLGSSFALWVTSPSPKPIQKEFESAANTAARLEQLHIGFAEDSLQKAINEVGQTLSNSRLVIFSDVAAAESPLADIDQIPILPLGFVRPNFAIEDAARSAGDTISVDIYGNQAALTVPPTCNLQVLAYEANQMQILASATVLPGTNNIALPSGSRRLPLKLNLICNDDSNLLDNTNYLSELESASQVIAVSSRSLEDLEVKQISSIQFSHLSPEEFKSSQNSLRDVVVLLDGMSTGLSYVSKEQANPTLVVMPTAGNITVSNTTPVKVASFQMGHPILRYLNPALLAQNAGFSLVRGRQNLLEVIRAQDGGSLLLAGKEKGQRTIVTGLRLLPYQGKKSPVESLLLLNSIRWLSSSTGNRQLDSQQVIDSALVTTDKQIVSDYAAPALYVDKNGKYGSRNFFSAQESSLVASKLTFPNSSVKQFQKGQSSGSLQPFEQLLLLIVAVCVAIDLLLNFLSRGYGSTSR